MLSTIALILVLLYLFYDYLEKHKRQWSLAKKLPGPYGLPLIGNSLICVGSMQEITHRLLDLMKRYKRMCKLWLGPSLLIFSYDAKDAEILLKDAKDIDKADEYKFWRPIVGDSLFSSKNGPKFRRNKKLVLPSFQITHLKEFFDAFNRHSDELIKNLESKVGKEFNIADDLSRCSTNILLETIFGYNEEQVHENSDLVVDVTERIVQCAMARVYKVWLRPDFIFNLTNQRKKQDKLLKILSDITTKVINARKSMKNSDIFVDSLLAARDDDGSRLADEDIANEIKTFLFAGQDTTSTSVGFTLCLIGLYQDAQERLYKDVSSILKPNYGIVTYDIIKDMEYLNMVVQETWRLYPPAPVVAKKVLKDIELHDGTIIPKDAAVAIVLYYVHRDPEYFPDPYKFNPDNFLPEKVNSRHPYSFIPFSAGYRTCIGQKYAQLLVKTLVAKLVLHYKFYSKQPEKDYKLSYETTFKKKDGFYVTLEKRT